MLGHNALVLKDLFTASNSYLLLTYLASSLTERHKPLETIQRQANITTTILVLQNSSHFSRHVYIPLMMQFEINDRIQQHHLSLFFSLVVYY